MACNNSGLGAGTAVPGLTSATKARDTLPPAGLLRSGGPDEAFWADLQEIRRELEPAGAIEVLLVDRLIQAAWRLHKVAQAEPADAFDVQLMRYEALVERSLYRALAMLERRQDRQPKRADQADTASPDLDGETDRPGLSWPTAGHDDGEDAARNGDDGVSDPGTWRGRLLFDPNVSATSPVVRGTWVTVDHVISLIVDGWAWADLLRSHPELTEEDVRACLAYHVQEGPGGLRP